VVCQGEIDLNQEMNIGAGAQCRISAAQLPETAAIGRGWERKYKNTWMALSL
jgi:hypothetical protein